ncbi:hypothetical protein DWB85_17580 [Seongchinamella sediminis]|uniref:Uncharacterized protein n=1 Tax=Seongchinamella sediminis TaxID=2283635 RepID=A0A3L7DRZ6_9GAMM|nr:hypothetical protein [Seongchinamella sediminis]RLQ20427.1 hypothetical protein DWB85_17580 [Seongchinamella sediminis]
MDVLLQASPHAAELSLQACKGAESVLLTQLGEAKAQVCLAASAEGLRHSLSWIILVMGVAGAGYLLICRRLQRDLVSRMH